MSYISEYWGIFFQGGPVMYLILACSLLVVAISVERYLFYRRMNTDMNKFVQLITPLLEKNEWAAAGALCWQTPGIVAAVAAKGICYIERGCVNVESVLEGEADLAVASLRSNLNYLDAIVTIAPLLGLLGTVIGMVGSFSVLSIKAGQPLAITGGVSEALIATASGLCVAILAMVVFSCLNHRLELYITQIEEICLLVLGNIKREKRYEIV